MTEIPLPWLVTVLTSILLLPLARAERLPHVTRLGLGVALLSLAIIGLLLGLRISFETNWAQRIQPFVAVLVPGSFWLGFHVLTVEDPYPWRRMALRHGGLTALALIGVSAGGADLVLPILTLIYFVALVRLYCRSGESFVHLATGDLRIARGSMLIVMALFVFVFLADLSILVMIALGRPAEVVPLVSGASGLLTTFVFLAVLIGLPLVFSRDGQPQSASDSDPATEEDRALLAQFDHMLTETALYSDSGLTLARAARRLGVPARSLSRAVNRVEGQNFSRHINTFRISRAQTLLRETQLPVTDIMLEAGFLTKSTFNTEFRRITGLSPSAFRASG